MIRRRPCPDCGRMRGRDGRRATCATMCLVLGAVVSPGTGRAQPPARPTTVTPLPVETTASVVIGALFQLEPSQPTLAENDPVSERCAPQSCFRGIVVLRSNSRWQLQVRLDPAAGVTAPITWTPTDGKEFPVSASWRSIADGLSPSSGISVVLRFAAGGAEAQRPDAAVLSTALQYRVLPLP